MIGRLRQDTCCGYDFPERIEERQYRLLKGCGDLRDEESQYKDKYGET